MGKKSHAFQCIKDFDTKIRRQFGLTVNIVRIDNEKALISEEGKRQTVFEDWTNTEGLTVELGPVYTKEPTGGSERAGGVLQDKWRCM